MFSRLLFAVLVFSLSSLVEGQMKCYTGEGKNGKSMNAVECKMEHQCIMAYNMVTETFTGGCHRNTDGTLECKVSTKDGTTYDPSFQKTAGGEKVFVRCCHGNAFCFSKWHFDQDPKPAIKQLEEQLAAKAKSSPAATSLACLLIPFVINA